MKLPDLRLFSLNFFYFFECKLEFDSKVMVVVMSTQLQGSQVPGVPWSV